MMKYSFTGRDLSTSAVMLFSLAYFGPECAAQRPENLNTANNSRDIDESQPETIFNRARVPLKADLNRARYFRRIVTSPCAAVKEKSYSLCENLTSKKEITDRLLKWTRENISIESDDEIYRNYIQEPAETLLRKKGTSREISVLYAAMCHVRGIETMLLDFGPHMSVAVEGLNGGDAWVSMGRRYRYAEPSQSVLGEDLGQMFPTFLPYALNKLPEWAIPIPCTRVIHGKTAAGRDFSISIDPETFFASQEDLSIMRDFPELVSRDEKKKFIASVFIRDSAVIKELSSKLAQGAATREEAAQHAFDFVQKIPYMHDYGEWYRPAIETLFEGCGDCEDTTALLVGIWRHMGLKTCVFVYEDHVAAGVAGNFQGQSLVFNDVRYFFTESTAGGGRRIGDKTIDKYRPLNAETFALPTVNRLP